MDVRTDIREFLTSRRARLTPGQVGLPDFGGRRVPGLRREEVAVLAGVSVPYYTRLERGELAGVSEGVLHALARALKLDDAESAHLFDLARAAQPNLARPQRRRQPRRSVRPDLQWVLDAMTGAAALVTNDRLDVIAANPLGRALFADVFEADHRTRNLARYAFLDLRARNFYPAWGVAAAQTVALLRFAAGRDPYDRDLSDLIGELSTRSEEFRTGWAAHDVRFHDAVPKHLHHAIVGDLDLMFTRFHVPGHDDAALAVYTAEPGSRSEEALRLLGSWSAAPVQTDPGASARAQQG